MADLLTTFDAFIQSHGLLKKDDSVVAAVSGGKDSVALLDLLVRWAPRQIVVAHVHHGLRPESDDEERFVAQLAAERGLDFYSHRLIPPQDWTGLSTEAWAREGRLAWLEALCQRLGFQAIALGHHAQDQAETLLMNLARGAGLRGLAGIRPQRGTFIRPLLWAMPQEIEDYVRLRNLAFVTDLSNLSRDYLRNRIRLDVLPALEAAVGHSVTDALARSAAHLREAQEGVEGAVQRALFEAVIPTDSGEIRLDIRQFINYFKSVQKAVLAALFETLSGQPGRVSETQIERLMAFALQGRPGQSLKLGSVAAIHDGHALVLHKVAASLRRRDVAPGEAVSLDEAGLIFASAWCPAPGPGQWNQGPRVAYLGMTQLPERLILRAPRPGDRFTPLGMAASKKLSDFLLDRRVPRWRRPAVPILEIDGRIAWVAGHRMDQAFRVEPGTRHCLRVEISSIDSDVPKGVLPHHD